MVCLAIMFVTFVSLELPEFLNYRTSIAHHDWFSTCTWLEEAIQAVPHW